MRRFATVSALLFAMVFDAFCGDVGRTRDFPLRGISYMQKGVLTYGGAELSVRIYVAARGDSFEMLADSDVGRVAKVSLGADGSELSCTGGVFLPARLVRKFALRDFRAALGFYEKIGVHVLINIEGGRVVRVLYGDSKIEFAPTVFSEDFGRTVPEGLEISSENYSLSLGAPIALKQK